MDFIPRFVRRLSITGRLAIAFIGLSLVPFLLSGIFGIVTHTRTLRAIALEHLEHDVLTVRERVGVFLSGVESDVLLLGSSPQVHQATALKLGDLQDEIYQATEGYLWAFVESKSIYRRIRRQAMVLDPTALQKDLLQDIRAYLWAFLESKPIYYRVRCLNANGEETCGVEREGRAYRFLPEKGRENRDRRHYLQAVDDLGPGEFASTPMQLMSPDGKLVPVLSYALPIHDRLQKRIGILTVDVFAEELFKVLEESPVAHLSGKVVLVSREGNYLYHPAKKGAWGWTLAVHHGDNLRNDYPQDVVGQILSGRPGIVSEGLGEIIAYTPLVGEKQAGGGSHILFETIPQSVVFTSVRSFEIFFAISFVLILIGASTLSFFAARHFTRPINELVSGAEIIARGDYDHRLSIHTNVEIERLAEQFNVMAGSIQEHGREIVKREAQLERNRLEAQIIQSEKLLTVGEMAALVAHEIRNALTSVKMILQLELESRTVGESDREALAVAIRSVYRMETIVNDLLRFATPSLARFMSGDVNLVVEEAITLVRHQFEQKKIDLFLALGCDLPSVLLDADQVKEALVNLFLNAAQAIVSGGRITVSTHHRRGRGPARIASACPTEAVVDECQGFRSGAPGSAGSEGIQAWRNGSLVLDKAGCSATGMEDEGGWVEIVVEDTGVGMSEEVLKRCFDPFYTTRADGTGLGLSITRRTIERHGGTISAKSSEGQGSRFAVLLPTA